MKLTREILKKIIKEEVGHMEEASGQYGLGANRPDSAFSELPDGPTELSKSALKMADGDHFQAELALQAAITVLDKMSKP